MNNKQNWSRFTPYMRFRALFQSALFKLHVHQPSVFEFRFGSCRDGGARSVRVRGRARRDCDCTGTSRGTALRQRRDATSSSCSPLYHFDSGPLPLTMHAHTYSLMSTNPAWYSWVPHLYMPRELSYCICLHCLHKGHFYHKVFYASPLVVDDCMVTDKGLVLTQQDWKEMFVILSSSRPCLRMGSQCKIKLLQYNYGHWTCSTRQFSFTWHHLHNRIKSTKWSTGQTELKILYFCIPNSSLVT